MGHIPAGRIGYTQHPNAFALTLIHQIIVFLNLLIWSVRSHLEPVIQPTTAGLRGEMENREFINSKVKTLIEHTWLTLFVLLYNFRDMMHVLGDCCVNFPCITLIQQCNITINGDRYHEKLP